MHRLLIGLICLLALIRPALASAQTPRDARVQVTVVDPAGLIVPEATVTLVGLEPATQAVTPAPAKTTGLQPALTAKSNAVVSTDPHACNPPRSRPRLRSHGHGW